MNWTIEFTEEFARGAKILKKRYKSFKHDLEDFTLTYCVSEESGKVHFLMIYDKSDADTVDAKIVMRYVEELGFNLAELQEQELLSPREEDF